MSCFLQMVAENVNKDVIKVVHISNNTNDSVLFEKFKNIGSNIEGIKAEFCNVSREKLFEDPNKFISDVDLLLINNLSTDDKICQILHRTLRRDSFVSTVEDCLEMSNQRPSALYQTICSHGIGNVTWELVLWRPSETTAGTSAFTVLSESDLSLVISSLPTLPPKQRIVILTSYPAIPGLKTLVKEWRLQGARKINVIVFKHKISGDQSLDQISFTNLAVNILDHGIWGGEYFLPLEVNASKGHAMALDIARLGDLDSLHWVEAPENGEQGINVQVHFAGVNQVDLKAKLGEFENHKSKKIFEFDFSGKTESGMSVMGIAQGDAISTLVKSKPEMLWPVPKYWSLEDAATVPLAYVIAFYCLTIKSNIRAGCSILVHGGAGALGQAVISIALAFGCEVFTTVSDIRKKKFLMKLFPELKADHISNSREIGFSDMVLHATQGDGVNLIVSCVKSDLKNATIKCCRPSGTMIDTSVVLNHEDYVLGMKFLGKGISYVTIRLSDLFEPENINELKRIQMMMTEGIARGYVRPLSRVVYAPNEATRAYRLVAGSRHRGRVLFNLQQDIPYMQTRISCSSERQHLVLSEDEALGMQLAQRLVMRGARKIILHFTKESNYLLYKIRSLEKQGVNVKVSYGNRLDGAVVINLVKESRSDGDLEGIYYVVSPDKNGIKVFKDMEMINLVQQELNLQLKYFAVLSKKYDDELMTVSLPEEKMLITRLSFGEADDADDNSMTSMVLVNTIEKALCSKKRFLRSHVPNKRLQSSFLNDIARVADINIPEDVSGETTLSDMGMDLSKVEAVRNYLRYKLINTSEHINVLNLKVDTIRDWENRNKETYFKDTKGLSTFFSYVDHDELLAVSEMVFLQTLTTSSSMRDDEFDVKQTYLCILPGIEAHHARFRILCERLKLPTLVLQPSCKPQETIQEMAHRLAKDLINKTKLKNRFFLLGYENGISVALEMAAILEEQGLVGTIFCIGGTPEEIQEKFTEELSAFNTEELLQSEVIRHMFRLMNSDKTVDLEVLLQSDLSWEEKVTRSLQMLLGKIPHSIQYAKEVIEAAYARINQVRNYVPNLKPLRSQIVYMRPRSSLPKCQVKQYSQKPAVEYELDAPLAYAAQDLRCAAYINRHLDEDILEAFENKNLLETYILNSDKFMTAALNDDD